MDNGKILAELKSQTVWLKVIALQTLKTTIQEEISSQEDKKIFELSDGVRTTRAIAKAAGVSHAKVAVRWNHWASLGLVIQGESFKGRYKNILSVG